MVMNFNDVHLLHENCVHVLLGHPSFVQVIILMAALTTVDVVEVQCYTGGPRRSCCGECVTVMCAGLQMLLESKVYPVFYGSGQLGESGAESNCRVHLERVFGRSVMSHMVGCLVWALVVEGGLIDNYTGFWVYVGMSVLCYSEFVSRVIGQMGYSVALRIAFAMERPSWDVTWTALEVPRLSSMFVLVFNSVRLPFVGMVAAMPLKVLLLPTGMCLSLGIYAGFVPLFPVIVGVFVYKLAFYLIQWVVATSVIHSLFSIFLLKQCVVHSFSTPNCSKRSIYSSSSLDRSGGDGSCNSARAGSASLISMQMSYSNLFSNNLFSQKSCVFATSLFASA